MKTKQNLIRTCRLCAAITVSATATIPCRAQTLADALDTPGLVWTNIGSWSTGGDGASHDGVDGAWSPMFLMGEGFTSSSLQTVVTGPTLVSFWWKIYNGSGGPFVSTWLALSVDGQSVTNLSSGNSGWSQQTAVLSSGSHILQWRHELMAFPGGSGDSFAYLDQVTFGAIPPPNIVANDGQLGFATNKFGFSITGRSNLVIVVEACTNLFNPVWQPVQTNVLTGGSSYFSDPQWTNYPGRFYRLRSL